MLTTKELIGVQTGFENCRDAVGWDRDLMVHCHCEYDLGIELNPDVVRAHLATGETWWG